VVYVVFSILSGALMVLVAAAASLSRSFDLTAGERAAGFLFGAGLIVYGIWAASADSGFFVFPAIIFVLPFLFVGYLVFQAWESWGSSKPVAHHAGAAAEERRPPVEPPTSPAPACPRCGSPPEPGAAWCTECGSTLHQAQPASAAVGPEPSRCRRCGTTLGGGFVFCTSCGQPATQAREARTSPKVAVGAGATPRRCVACQGGLEPTDLFCTQCGQSQTP
jgi:hypothetical protein